MLHISRLDVRYGEVQAVVSVDVEINLGEIVSITGTTGAGKSSVLNAISGIQNIPPRLIKNSILLILNLRIGSFLDS